jgi:hypothetical protein
VDVVGADIFLAGDGGDNVTVQFASFLAPFGDILGFLISYDEYFHGAKVRFFFDINTIKNFFFCFFGGKNHLLYQKYFVNLHRQNDKADALA